GSWKLEAGSWKLEAGSWKLERSLLPPKLISRFFLQAPGEAGEGFLPASSFQERSDALPAPGPAKRAFFQLQADGVKHHPGA
ncbi:hypothetical protein, partial [uncultured Halomonas sp.]|uniref:hypothetical protein n=1 Tax=uncultured Halomonas sp. TaxID=173971 RepID=UPI0026127596